MSDSQISIKNLTNVGDSNTNQPSSTLNFTVKEAVIIKEMAAALIGRGCLQLKEVSTVGYVIDKVNEFLDKSASNKK